MQIPMRFPLFSLLLLALLPAPLAAQQFFEGSLEYKVEMTGPRASSLMLNEPNNKMIMHVKDDHYIVQLSGGKYPKTFLFVPDSNRQYVVDAEKRVVYKHSPFSDADSARRAEPVVNAVSTGRVEQVQGEACAIFELKRPGEVTLYYVSDKYFINKGLFGPKSRASAMFLVPGLDGRIPLRKVTKQDGLTVTTELIKITPRKFDVALFQFPFDYEFRKRYYGY